MLSAGLHRLRLWARGKTALVPVRMWRYRRQLRRALNWLPADLSALGGSLNLQIRRPKILVATTTGGHLTATSIDSVLACALRLRDADVEILLCDAALPVCMLCESHLFPDVDDLLARGPKALCGPCVAESGRLYRKLGLRVRRLSDLLTDEDRRRARTIASETASSELEALNIGGLPVGEQARAGVLRFLARGDLTEPGSERLLRAYVEAALLVAAGAERLFSEGFDAAVLHHGIYVPQGVLAAAARNAGTRVVTWNTAYRQSCFLFSHDDSYHFTMMSETTADWQNMIWTDAMRRRIEDYLRSRWTGTQDWITYQRSDGASFDARRQLGLDTQRPIITLLTNVNWDAQLYYRSNAFPSLRDWVLDTIAWFSHRPDLQLVLRIHPAETRNPLVSRQLMADEIAGQFPALPENVKVIGPDDPLNTYALAEISDSVLIYGTKTGVELAARGIPVIVAGEAWIRNKGIAEQANTRAEYFDILASLPRRTRLPADVQDRALRYAYHFFFRRMIPLEMAKSQAGWPPFAIEVDSLDRLQPGRSRGLDLVCAGILTGAPFIWPSELDEQTSATQGPERPLM